MEFYVSIGCVFTKFLFLIPLQNFCIKFACFFVATHTYARSLTFRNQLAKNKFSLFFVNFPPFTFKTEIFNFPNIFFFHFNTHRLRVRFLGKNFFLEIVRKYSTKFQRSSRSCLLQEPIILQNSFPPHKINPFKTLLLRDLLRSIINEQSCGKIIICLYIIRNVRLILRFITANQCLWSQLALRIHDRENRISRQYVTTKNHEITWVLSKD